MRTTRSTLRSALAAVTVAAALTAGAAPAYADGDKPKDDPTEDSRAVVYQGNVKGSVDMCAAVGAAGKVIDTSDLASKVTPRENEDRYLTIKSVRDGATITAIVVKGGPRYNVYVPGERGLSASPPWEDLRAPLNDGGNIAAISHWYACWVPENPETTDSTPPATTTTTTATPPGSETSTPDTETSTPDTTTTITTTPGVSTTSSPSSSGQPAAPEVTSTTNAAPAVSSGDTENLAYTGFNNAWLVWLGGALVLAGAAALVLLRVRRVRQSRG